MGEIIKSVLAVIGALGGIAVVVGSLAAWLGKVLADRLYLKDSAKHQKEIEEFKNLYTTELEHLRADITERRDLLNNTHAALSIGYDASHEQIVAAIEELWKTIREVRAFASPYIFFYQLVSPREYDNVTDKIIKILPKIPQKDFDIQITRLRLEIEDKRPFIGESLWFTFWVYRAFTLRLAFKVVRGRDSRKFYEWNKNEYGKEDAMFEVLHYVLTDKEQEAVINTGPIKEMGVPQRIMDLLERKMLDEMNEWIFGKRLIHMSIEEQQRIASLLQPIQSIDQDNKDLTVNRI
jgi:hypothetical protein